jgi:hypothetical protein
MRQLGPVPLPASVLSRAVAVALVCLAAVATAACGSGTGASTPPPTVSADAIVKPPDFTLQGCTYVFDSTIPAGEPQGLKPTFPPFGADQSATDALRHIRSHGGVAMVDSVDLPGGTDLYAGPDTAALVGSIPSADSILAAEPVVWTDAQGGKWLAFFLSCGGQSLYWVSVDGVEHQNHSVGTDIAQQIAESEKAPPYTQTGSASLLPIEIDGQRRLTFTDPKVIFLVGRGELVGVGG